MVQGLGFAIGTNLRDHDLQLQPASTEITSKAKYGSEVLLAVLDPHQPKNRNPKPQSHALKMPSDFINCPKLTSSQGVSEAINVNRNSNRLNCDS